MTPDEFAAWLEAWAEDCEGDANHRASIGEMCPTSLRRAAFLRRLAAKVREPDGEIKYDGSTRPRLYPNGSGGSAMIYLDSLLEADDA